MSLYSFLKNPGPSGFGYGSTAEEVTEGLDLRDKTVLITGCNSGLGYETMKILALRGAQVIGAARTLEKANQALKTIQGKAIPVACELSDPQSILSCVDAVKGLNLPLDVIICNAGIMAPHRLQQFFGYESQFFTNHIGHFILVTHLLQSLNKQSRVVILSSDAHRMAPKAGIEWDNLSGNKSYKPWTAYGQSKLANILFAKELARRFDKTGKTANAVHPGVIQTNLIRDIGPFTKVANWVFSLGTPLFLKTIPQGAATSCFVAVHPDAASINGAYFSNCNIAKPIALAEDPDLAKKLWEISEKICHEIGIKSPPDFSPV